MHFFKIGLVLRRCVTAEADAVAEVVAKRAGHDGIEVDNGDPLARGIVQHHVVELGVVVRHAERDLPEAMASTNFPQRELCAFTHSISCSTSFALPQTSFSTAARKF